MTAETPVKLPNLLVWELWKRAESKNVKVADVISEALRLADRPPVVVVAPTTLETHEKVKRLVQRGWDDGRIAVHLDRTRAYVADVRRRYGLKPNKRGGERSA